MNMAADASDSHDPERLMKPSADFNRQFPTPNAPGPDLDQSPI